MVTNVTGINNCERNKTEHQHCLGFYSALLQLLGSSPAKQHHRLNGVNTLIKILLIMQQLSSFFLSHSFSYFFLSFFLLSFFFSGCKVLFFTHILSLHPKATLERDFQRGKPFSKKKKTFKKTNPHQETYRSAKTCVVRNLDQEREALCIYPDLKSSTATCPR